MNEASSKYVDKLAVDKLVLEKLSKVNHYPDASNNIEINLSKLKDLNYSQINIEKGIVDNIEFNSFISPVISGYEENDRAHIYVNYSNKSAKIGNIIFVHGLYEDNLELYNYFISQLNNLGVDVYLFVLPFHYSRKPKSSQFSGEYFWSGNIYRSVFAFKQSLFDLYIYYTYLKSKSNLKTLFVGFSMGGGITLSLASLVELDGLFAINPVSNITSLVWNSKLFLPVKKDFESAGLDFNDVKKYFEEFEPMDKDTVSTSLENINIGFGLFDQINDPQNYRLLIDKWEILNFYEYKAGHLNIFRVPKLTTDISKIFD